MNAGSQPSRLRRDPLPLLSDLAAAAWSRPQPDAAFAALGEAVEGALGALLFTVLVHDAVGGTMRRVFSTRPDVNPVGGTKPVTESDWMKQVLQRGEPYIGRTREDLGTAFFDHELLWSIGCGSVLNMPIVWAGRVLGSLNMLHEEGWYDEADLPTARLLAQLALPTVIRP